MDEQVIMLGAQEGTMQVVEAIGRKIGQPKQDVKLSNNAIIQEEDTTWMGSNYMPMAGISHVKNVGGVREPRICV